MVQGLSACELQDQDWALGPCAFLAATRWLQGKGRDTDVGSSFPSCLGTQDPDLQVTEGHSEGETFTWITISPVLRMALGSSL